MGVGCSEEFSFLSGGPSPKRSCIGSTILISIKNGGHGSVLHLVIAINCGFNIGKSELLYAALSTVKIQSPLRVNISLKNKDVRLKEVLSSYVRIIIPFHVLRMFFILKYIVVSFTCSDIHFFNLIFFRRISSFIGFFGLIDLLMCCPYFIYDLFKINE